MIFKVNLQRPKTNFLPSYKVTSLETKTQCAHVHHRTQMTTETAHSSKQGNVNVTVKIKMNPFPLFYHSGCAQETYVLSGDLCFFFICLKICSIPHPRDRYMI